jgi:hypothetical protein
MNLGVYVIAEHKYCVTNLCFDVVNVIGLVTIRDKCLCHKTFGSLVEA